jgi:alanyl-tRNA synthetase
VRTSEIRESFLSFFESKGCKRMPSSSLIPDDPSLLLTTAGMVQFKPVFLGLKTLGFTRATTVQKCVRTTDIDIIGTTGRHHSFFEMLGNFSFGDYFKSEACAWAYEYSTEVLGLDPDKLWFSIYDDDDEAERIWTEEVGVPRERIVRMGAKDNFWSAGPTGPCGPCSELYYDQGPELGCGSPDCAPGCDCDRYLEYWNLVFMQYDRQEDGSLLPLPKKNIDTGMGLERIAAILQHVNSNFETDVLRSLMAQAEAITGARYGTDDKTDTSLRILADHSRALAFLIADGVLPSNEGRGYVLRRLLRRAVRHGRLLGVNDPFLGRLTALVIELMGDAYPEVLEHRELIAGIVQAEEQRFNTTLRQGMAFLEDELAALASSEQGVLDGRTAFALHDTYGFPVELTAEIAAEAGVSVDMASFETEMEAQRERGRAGVKDESWSAYGGVWAQVGASEKRCEFLGYAKNEADATVSAIVAEGEMVTELQAGSHAEVVLDRTPFYGEQGGQVGDTGRLTAEGLLFRVDDTRIAAPGIYAHVGELVEGTLRVGDDVHAAIDVMRRERIRRNHTATHLLHWALRLVLGEHVKQSGSHVAPERLRFDFTHFEAMTSEQTAKVERLVNAKVMENHPVRAYETSLATARESGVTALFGEKYGDFVRVLEVGNFSKELCGGTHVARTSEIGFLKILSESSVGANLRRIEAVTSFDAMDYVRSEEGQLAEVAAVLKASRYDAAEKTAALVKRVKELESSQMRAKATLSQNDIESLSAGIVDVGYPLLVARVPTSEAADLRGLWDVMRTRLGAAAVVLASVAPSSGTPLLLAAATPEAIGAGFDAGAVIRAIAPAVKGGGGGKPEMAQAGGKDASGIDEALGLAREMLGAR